MGHLFRGGGGSEIGGERPFGVVWQWGIVIATLVSFLAYGYAHLGFLGWH